MTLRVTDDTGLEPVTEVLETTILPVKLTAYKIGSQKKERMRA